jgi:hypothetical protein
MKRQPITLPQLDRKLDSLTEGAWLEITRDDYERLFGLNDVAIRRLRHFANSHACVASFADSIVLFRKKARLQRRDVPAPAAK